MSQKSRKYTSPREESLNIALKTRDEILDKNPDVISILRSCLVIASNLNKKEDVQWILDELRDRNSSDDFPEYRRESCPVYDNYNKFQRFQSFNVWESVHTLRAILETKFREMTIRLKETPQEYLVLQETTINKVLNSIVDRCLFFLNNVVIELQYGGVVEYLMEEIRKETDEKIITISTLVSDETQSLVQNLTSTNPADWNQVAHSCRKMIKLAADMVFPPSDSNYKLKDGREIAVKDSHYINRLLAYFDQILSGDERKFIFSELEYLENYIRSVVAYTQMGEHKSSIEKYHANKMAIHTYLILSEILKTTT